MCYVVFCTVVELLCSIVVFFHGILILGFYFFFIFFFFKQKTAYEMLRSLVGSEMCIRDSLDTWDISPGALDNASGAVSVLEIARILKALDLKTRRSVEFVLFMAEEEGHYGSELYVSCLLYTSDAADDLLCVDLGGRRIIKKKQKK